MRVNGRRRIPSPASGRPDPRPSAGPAPKAQWPAAPCPAASSRHMRARRRQTKAGLSYDLDPESRTVRRGRPVCLPALWCMELERHRELYERILRVTPAWNEERDSDAMCHGTDRNRSAGLGVDVSRDGEWSEQQDNQIAHDHIPMAAPTGIRVSGHATFPPGSDRRMPHALSLT